MAGPKRTPAKEAQDDIYKNYEDTQRPANQRRIQASKNAEDTGKLAAALKGAGSASAKSQEELSQRYKKEAEYEGEMVRKWGQALRKGK